MGKKTRKTRQLSAPPPASFDGPPATDPVKAMAALSSEVTEQITTIGNTVAKIDERIEVIDRRSASMGDEIDASIEKKFAELKAGEQFAELADRLDKDQELIGKLDAAISRMNAMGPANSNERKLGNPFAQELASGPGMERYRELAESEGKKAVHQFKMDNLLPFSRQHGFAGESTVVVDSSDVGDASDPYVIQGLTELIRDPVGLVDIINEVPGISDVDTFKEMIEDESSSKGHVVAAANGTQDGATTPQAFVTVHNTEGFIAGQTVYVWPSTGTAKQGPFTISTITAGSKINFATAVIDFVVTDGDYVTGEEFAATAESGFKPAGLLKASLASVDIQTLATYVIMTRQRLRRTNLFDLSAWAARRLPVRLREVLEWHLLYGSGTAPQFHGFLNSTLLTSYGVQTDTWSTDLESGGNRADLLLWSAANIPGMRQKFAVMHKLDWWKLTNAKDDNGNYLHGQGEGPAIIDTPTTKAVGGLRVVLSDKIAETYALVFDPIQASSFARIQDAEMTVGWVNDQMIQNQQTMLYEQSFGHLLKVGTAWRRCYFNSPPV